MSGVQFTHRGDLCIDLADFQLNDPVLHDLAAIVRAPIREAGPTPQSAACCGLSGLSVLYEDDLEMLRQGMIVYTPVRLAETGARGDPQRALFQVA